MMEQSHIFGVMVVGEDVGYFIWASKGFKMYIGGRFVLSLVSDDLTGQSFFNPVLN